MYIHTCIHTDRHPLSWRSGGCVYIYIHTYIHAYIHTYMRTNRQTSVELALRMLCTRCSFCLLLLLLRETSRRHKVHAPRHITKLKLNQTTGPVSVDKVHERGGRWARPLNKEGVGRRQREEKEGGTRRVISLAVSPSPPCVCGCLSRPLHPSLSLLSLSPSISLPWHHTKAV